MNFFRGACALLSVSGTSLLHNIIVLHRAREVEKWRRNIYLVPVLEQAWENHIPEHSFGSSHEPFLWIYCRI